MLPTNWSRSIKSETSHLFIGLSNVTFFFIVCVYESVHFNQLKLVFSSYRSSSNPTEDQERKKAKKNPVNLQQPPTPKDTNKDSKLHKRCSGETQESSKETVKRKDSHKHRKSSGKRSQSSNVEKVTVKNIKFFSLDVGDCCW